MTALESRRRREQRRKSAPLLCRKFLRKTKSFVKRIESTRLRTTAKSSSGDDILRLDAVITALIHMEVSMLLEEQSKRHSSLTVLTVANALLGSIRVREQYAKADSVEADQDEPRGMFGFSFGVAGRRRKENRLLARRYAYTNALRRVETQPGAVSKVVKTWEQAREELSVVFDFPREETVVADPTSSRDDPVMQDFTKRLNTITLHESSIGLRPSQRLWQEVANAALSPKIIDGIVESMDRSDQNLSKRLEEEYKKREEREKNEALEQLQRQLKEKEAQERAASLMRPPTDEERVRTFYCFVLSEGNK